MNVEKGLRASGLGIRNRKIKASLWDGTTLGNCRTCQCILWKRVECVRACFAEHQKDHGPSIRSDSSLFTITIHPTTVDLR